MNELQIFNNTEFGDVRTVEINGKPYFMASDVAKALGYTNPNKAINDHCRAITKCSTPISGKIQEVNFISEGDIYRLVVKSQLPNAEKFEAWIFDEVLPAIRKHGAYMTPETLEQAILNPDTIIKIATALKEEQNKNIVLEAENSALTVENQIMQPKASYFDELVDRNLLTGFRETAKQFGIKQNVFIKFLIEKKYIYRDKRGNLVPYAAKNNGLFEIKESYNEKTNWTGTQTMITPKGRETFRLLIMGIA